jgi:hypothetical protein
LSPNALRRSLLVLIGVTAGTCVLWALLRRDDLLGLTGCIGLIGLAIWVLIALQRCIDGANHCKDADGSEDAHQKRRWQFSLRSLFVVTIFVAGLCSFLKVVPVPFLVASLFVVYIGGVFAVVLVTMGLICCLIRFAVGRIERRLSGSAGRSTPPDADHRNGEPESTSL